MSTYHQILGIKTSATKIEIKNAYRKLAKKYHPDRNKSENAHDKFLEISEAYDVLIDDEIAIDKTANSNQKKQTAKEKYWHVYEPPENPDERVEWDEIAEERKRFYKEKAKKDAKNRYENFRKESESFKKSIMYYPLYVLYSLVQLFFIIGAITILFLPFIGHYIDPEKYEEVPFETGMVIFVIIVLGPVSFFFIKGLLYLKKVIDPYFQEF